MRTIYVDSDFVCHAEQAEGLRPIETDFFDEKCPEYISGFRLIPDGEQWVHPDGRVFHGFQIFSWKPYDRLLDIQDAVDSGCKTFESDIKLLKKQMSAQNAMLDFYEECIAEMAEIVYA